ncbi:alpha/beta hydrolase [Polyangium sp. 6x1]|uniref:alpha/beta hydrolase n=1 Tax=Polyangium sp. 6x1 TaxID=3042689 RepID=UPI00248243BE|nr:alpha/beta hydrolase [Polyangium sp. 6x1]MDI1445296.1 alpha/beta hydrolase [Polyangium sp. 6x1]
MMFRSSAPFVCVLLLVSSACDAARSDAARAGAPVEHAPSAKGSSAPAATAPAAVAPSASVSPEAASAVPPPPPPPSGPAMVEALPMPDDLPIALVKSADGKPPRIVFLPGICSNAGAYLWGFAEAARAHGGAIAIDGDRPCGNSRDFHSITSDPKHEGPRIRAALAAAGHTSPDSADVVLVGYSLGVTLIENLVKESPERWPHVVLIGASHAPRLDRLKGIRRVATMSCSLDVPGRMKAAARMFEGASIPARYFEMPGCTHGNIAEGNEIFSDVFDWLEAK